MVRGNTVRAKSFRRSEEEKKGKRLEKIEGRMREVYGVNRVK